MANNDTGFSNQNDEKILLQDDNTQIVRNSADKTKLSTYANEDKLEDWRVELTKLEYEIQTLKSVLQAKHREAIELKKKLGITQMSEIKQDLQYGLQTVKESNAYLKTSSALKNIGSFASQKLGNLRNSNAFKSVEGKVGNAYSNVKTRLKHSKSGEGYERELDDKNDLNLDEDEELSGKLSVENKSASPGKT